MDPKGCEGGGRRVPYVMRGVRVPRQVFCTPQHHWEHGRHHRPPREHRHRPPASQPHRFPKKVDPPGSGRRGYSLLRRDRRALHGPARDVRPRTREPAGFGGEHCGMRAPRRTRAAGESRGAPRSDRSGRARGLHLQPQGKDRVNSLAPVSAAAPPQFYLLYHRCSSCRMQVQWQSWSATRSMGTEYT